MNIYTTHIKILKMHKITLQFLNSRQQALKSGENQSKDK